MFKNDVALSDIDIYTGQYYPLNISALNTQAGQVRSANKVFIAEEYAWNNKRGGDPLDRFLSDIETNFAVTGDMFWSLFGHKDTFGYVQHNDGYTLHYPGDTDDMRRRVQALRTHAYRMKGEQAPAYKLSTSPLITNTTPGLEWRGVAGADTYTIERSTAGPDGPWKRICDRCATDNDLPWIDKNKPKGKLWYRMIAYSPSGTASSYSPAFEGNIASPIEGRAASSHS